MMSKMRNKKPVVESVLPNDLREFMISHGYSTKTEISDNGDIRISYPKLPLKH